MNLKIAIILFLAFIIPAIAQSDIKIGKPTQQDFNYTQCDFEPDASAVILEESGFLFIDYNMASINVKRRIKILDEAGISSANIQIPYYYGYSKIENITNIKAYTINGTFQKPEIVEIDKKDIYVIDLNKYYKEVRIAFPAVKAGSILDLSYQFETKNLAFIDSWEFQHELPVENSFFTMKNNTTTNFNSISQGLELVNQLKNKTNIRDIHLKKLSSYQEIDQVYNYKDYINKISFQNGTMSAKWTGLVKEKLDYLKQNKRIAPIKKIAEIIPKSADPKVLAQNIANYVQENIGWNCYTGQWPDKDINQIIKDKTSTSAGINYLYFLIAEQMDLNIQLVMISSRQHGKIISSFPYLNQFDHLVNLIEFPNGETWLLDASDFDKNQIQFFPLKLSNHYGLIMNQDANFATINQPFSRLTFRQTYQPEDQMLKLTQNQKWTGYFNNPQDQYNSSLQIDNLFGLTMDQTKVNTKEYKIDAYFLKNDYYLDLPDQQIITLQNPLEKFIQIFNFKNPQRQTIEYDFPFQIKGTVILQIPDNYSVTHPTDQMINQNPNINYAQEFLIKNNNLQITYLFTLNKPNFTQEEIPQLHSTLNTILDTARQKIILTKTK